MRVAEGIFPFFMCRPIWWMLIVMDDFFVFNTKFLDMLYGGLLNSVFKKCWVYSSKELLKYTEYTFLMVLLM